MPLSSSILPILKAMGRFRPTSQVSRKILRALRRRERIQRWVSSRIAGKRIRLDLDEMVDQKIFLYGAFDERGVALIRSIMRTIGCRTYLDIGANIGNHVALLERDSLRTCAFEPNPPIFERLKTLVESNGLSKVRVFPVGLSDRDGELQFYLVPQAAHVGSFEFREGAEKGGTAPVRIGDAVMEEENIADIDLIKIDVEGHEFEVLNGLQKTIARDRPIIVMEYEGRSLERIGRAGFATLLPGYAVHGTRRTLGSRLFKTKLSLCALADDTPYSHIVCVPEEKLRLFPFATR